MKIKKKSKETVEFGDFQTPAALARKCCGILSRQSVQPASIVEPTCGRGNFLLAALEEFPAANSAVGMDLNASYVGVAASRVKEESFAAKTEILHADFFSTDWRALLNTLPDPLLIVGNPPWVTNAKLETLGSSNLPKKSNFQAYSGLDAITGKSNFDISEWMLTKLVGWLHKREATLAMLCKTSVARKVLTHAWTNNLNLRNCTIYKIDAAESFGVSVDACFLVCGFAPGKHNFDCDVYEQLEDSTPATVIGYRDGRLFADVTAYENLKHLRGNEVYRWRSGIKHDCAKVMEFRKQGNLYLNGLGEAVELEDKYLYPMLKSSDVANGGTNIRARWMLVTQKSVKEATADIQAKAPKTWRYLSSHSELLDRRASSVYRDRPQFAVFGVGDYSFAAYKVAISGFYKELSFSEIGNVDGKPIVLDDTCYFLPCDTKEEAAFITALLNSQLVRDFYSARIFWDAKRPITIDILRQLDIAALCEEMHCEKVLFDFLKQKAKKTCPGFQQLTLFS